MLDIIRTILLTLITLIMFGIISPIKKPQYQEDIAVITKKLGRLEVQLVRMRAYLDGLEVEIRQ